MVRRARFFILATSAALFLGCNSYVNKLSDDIAPQRAQDFAKFSFDMVLSEVIAPRCLDCHSSATGKKPKLMSYSDVMQFIKPGDPMHSDLFTDLQGVGGDMPKDRSPIGPNQRMLIELWIASGAPQMAGQGHMPTMPVGTPTPTPSIIPVTVDPTYASLNKNVFVPYCIKCHSPHPDKNKGPDGDLDLTSYQTLIASVDSDTGIPDVLVTDAADSALYDFINKGEMPRPKTDPRLSANVADAILKWISAGALNN